MNDELRRSYDFFRAHGAGYVGESAVCSLRLARAELRMRSGDAGLAFYVEDEPWDGEPPAPQYLFCCFIVEGAEDEQVYDRRGIRCWSSSEPPWKTRDVSVRNSLGMVGVDSWSDPYFRVIAAELASEAYAEIDAERDAEACAGAAELAARPTFAGPTYQQVSEAS